MTDPRREDEAECGARSDGRVARRWVRRAAAVAVGIGGAILVLWALPTDARQQILNGVFRGSIYALIALGYTMVYGVLKLINFAHGEVFMVGAVIGYYALSAYQSTPWLAVVVALAAAMLGCAVLGIVIEKVAYRPLRSAPRLAALITAIGVSLLLQNLGMLVVGASPKTVPSVIPTAQLEGFYQRTGLSLNAPKLVALLASLLLMVGLHLVVSRSRIGRAMRAVSEDREAAMMMGIPIDLVISATFVIGSALAGAAGVLWGILFPSVSPLMGLVPGLKAFVAAVLGGIGSIPGAMVGGMLIGVIEVLTSAVQASGMQVAHGLITLLMLVAFWRLGQQHLINLPHTRAGHALRAAGTVLVGWACVVTAGLVAAAVTPLLVRAPWERSISGSTFQDAVVFAILVVILLVKPTGVMGRYAPEKV